MIRTAKQVVLVLYFLGGVLLGLYLGAVIREGHAQSADVQAALQSASVTEGVNYWCLHRIAKRESRFLPWVDNYQGSGAGGLFQFMASTWRENAPKAGYWGAPQARYDAWSAAHVAAWMIARPWTGALGHWGEGWGRTC
jgi:hypothetical protein